MIMALQWDGGVDIPVVAVNVSAVARHTWASSPRVFRQPILGLHVTRVLLPEPALEPIK